MLVRLVCVGKVRERYIADAVADFSKRLGPYLALETIEVKAADGSRPEAAMVAEARAILKHIDAGDTVWLLDREGRQWSSEELAAELERQKNDGTKRLVAIVAGTYGAAPALVARANQTWSLSRLTFLHEWARALVLEQLYRASKIARNEPYHH